MDELVIVHEVHGEATVAASDWNGEDIRLNAEGWRSRGWSAKGEKPADPVLTFDELIKPDWRDAFVAAGLDSVAAIAAATAEQIDAVEVKGLGSKTAHAIAERARAAITV